MTALTGAGVSAASGVPTFRGAGGLWKSHRPEDLATPEAFDRDPRLVWEWYEARRQAIAACRPNRAHEVLAIWSRRFSEFHLITQNVDGLHERAGTNEVVRFHGSIWELACAGRCAASPRSWSDDRVPLPDLPPPCPSCGGLARPAVVWFGEAIDPAVLQESWQAARCDLFVSIGTSALVSPATLLRAEAARWGAFIVEINPEETPASSDCDLVLRGPAERILDEIEARLTDPAG